MASIAGLFLFAAPGADPKVVDLAVADPGGGLEGDHHGARPKRGVLAVDRSVLDELGFKPGALREQVTIEGLPGLDDLEPGTRLTAGTATFEVLEKCAPCLTIASYIGADDPEALRNSLEGRRGVFIKILDAETRPALSVGDDVRVLSQEG